MVWSRKWRYALPAIVLCFAAVAAVIAALPLIEDRITFGTFSTQGPPPRIDYCNRRYYPDANFPNSPTESGSAVAAELSANGFKGLTRVGTTPSGMSIVTHLVMTPAQQAGHDMEVCTMVLWVQTGSDRYVGYSLAGGP